VDRLTLSFQKSKRRVLTVKAGWRAASSGGDQTESIRGALILMEDNMSIAEI
jgi:hypothetical protein